MVRNLVKGVRLPSSYRKGPTFVVDYDDSSPMSRVYYVAVLQMMPLVCLFLSLVVYLRLTGRRSPWFWLLPLVPVPVHVFRILRQG